jgi:hypothetical protein
MIERGNNGKDGDTPLRRAIAKLILTEVGPTRKLTPLETEDLVLDKDPVVDLAYTALKRRLSHLVDDIERLVEEAKPEIDGLRGDLDRTIDHQTAGIIDFYETVRALPEAQQRN